MADATLTPGVAETRPAASAPARRGPSVALRVIAWTARLAVAAVFFNAAWAKILYPAQFGKDIRSYLLFPVEFTNIMAFTIPWIEAVAAGLLVLGFWRREARLLVGLMLLAFTPLKAYAAYFGLKCGCFGDSWMATLTDGWYGVAFNGGLLALLLVEWLCDAGIRRARRPAR